MKIAQIRKYDVANGPGIRTTVFVSGCTHNCPGCFNKEYQSFEYGKAYSTEVKDEILTHLANPNVKGISVLGGEPFQNVDGLIDLLDEAKKRFPDKNVWIWSGYKYDEIVADPQKKQLLLRCDVLVDGKFIAMKKNAMLKFRGSSNQRIIDVKESLNQNKAVIIKED